MGDLVREKALTCWGLGAVLGGSEGDVGADGERSGAQPLGGIGRVVIGVDADAPEVAAHSLLEERTWRGVQRPALPQRQIMHCAAIVRVTAGTGSALNEGLLRLMPGFRDERLVATTRFVRESLRLEFQRIVDAADLQR
jgi:hypothetical protein